MREDFHPLMVRDRESQSTPRSPNSGLDMPQSEFSSIVRAGPKPVYMVTFAVTVDIYQVWIKTIRTIKTD